MWKLNALLVSGLFFILAGCNTLAMDTSKTSDPLEGAWIVQSVHWTWPDGTNSIDEAQPGRFLFVDGHYTLMWTNTVEPRTPFAILSEPTDDEIKAAFRSIVFNAGTYVVEGNRVAARAEIARVPGFEGGQQFYTYEIEGDILNLTMVDETYASGEKPDWSGKLETLFVLKRAP